MATGHYVTRYDLDEATGKKVAYRVWVPDPPVTATPKRRLTRAQIEARRRARAAAAAARARAAARAAAQRAARTAAERAAAQRAADSRASLVAERRAAQAKIAQSRKDAYAQVQKRAAELVKGAKLIPNKTSSAPTVRVASLHERLEEREEQRKAALRHTQEQPTLLAGEAGEANTLQRLQTVRELQYRDRKKRALVTGATTKDLETALADEVARAKRGQIDGEHVGKLAEKYVAMAEQVAAGYKALVDKINDAIDKGNTKVARSLYYSEAFRGLAAQYTELFGSGKDARADGSFNRFWKQYGEIEDAQTEWWKRQMRSTLNSDRQTIEQELERARADHDWDKYRELTKLAQVYDGQTGQVLDHYELVKDSRGEHYRPVYRARTVQEELDYRQAQKRIELEKLRAKWALQQRQISRAARKEGLVDAGDGNFMSKGQAGVFERMQKLVAARGGAAPTINRPEDLTHWADEVLRDWEHDNPQPKFARGSTAALEKWRRERAAFEREIYDFYGAGVPGFLERTFQLPGVSHGLSILQGGVSAIGAGGRALNKAAFGDSQIGGYGVDLKALPASVKAGMDKAGAEARARLAGNPKLEQGVAFARQGALGKWLNSAEGQAWKAKNISDQKAEVREEDLAFNKGFYGDGDAGAKLDALNKYGSEPFGSGEANLLFQLLADPTNAIPLKFTTYLARGKYAAELAGKTTFLKSTKLGRARDFVAVDEGVLKLRSELGKALKSVGDGRSVKQLTEDLLADVAGITSKTARDKAIRARLTSMGLAPRLIDDTQLVTLIEEAIQKRLKSAGVDYSSQATEQRLKEAEREEARRAAAEGRVKGQSESRIKAEARRKDEIKAAETKRERLAAMKTAEETKPKPVRTAKPVAKAPQPVVRVVPEAARKIETKVTKVASRVRGAGEYYKPDPFGNLLPVGSKVASDPRYKATVAAAKAGDLGARASLAKFARVRRNVFKREAEDRLFGSPYRATEVDFLEAAGVGGADEGTQAAIIADREQIRALVRKAGRGTSDASLRDETFKVLGHEGRPLPIGEDLIAARDLTGNKLKGVYEVFSGGPGRAGRYRGGLFDKVRDANWRKKHLGPVRFRGILEKLDDAELIGAGGFRDGGQALFELFHLLRRSGDTAKLKRLSAVVDDMIAEGDDLGSVFAWQWKVMEERAGLGWALDAEVAEAGFIEAAKAFDLHPNLALSMIPNGFYAHAQGPRFRVSRALLDFADSPSFVIAPLAWVESDVLRSISQLFARDTAGGASRVLDYVAGRYGSFGRANLVTHRIFGELARRAVGDLGANVVAGKLLKYLPPDYLERVGATAADGSATSAISRVLSRREKFAGSGGLKSLELDKYPELEAAVEAAYWAGDLPHLSVEGHRLMLFRQLQENPGAWLAPTRVTVDYLMAAGRLDAARDLVRAVFARRIEALPYRAAAELLDRSAPLTAEWKLWDDLGMIPDASRVEAWLANRSRGFDEGRLLDTLAAQEGIHLPGERTLDRFADNTEDQVERDFLASHDRDEAQGTYAGTNDIDGLRDRIYVALHAEKADRAVQELAALARMMVGGASAIDMEELRDLVETLAKGRFGDEVAGLLEDVRDEVGLEVMGRWVGMIDAFPEIKSTLGNPRRRKPDPNLLSKLAIEAPPLSATADVAHAAGVLEAVGGMTEEQWWKVLGDRQNTVLRNPRASAKSKARARSILEDIRKARWVKGVLSGADAYAGPAARRKFRNSVEAAYGRDAEELMRPNAVAPYVEDAQGLAVERTRQYWRKLQGTTQADVPGVKALGPKNGLDHMPVELFDALDKEIADELYKVRQVRAGYLTGRRRRGQAAVEDAVRFRDKDPVVLDVKRKVLAKHGVAVEAYDEARGALRWALVQQRTAARMMRVAEWISKRSGEDYRAVYLRLRDRAARADARHHLGWLAEDEMFGVDPELVFEEFVARWADDGQLRREVPPLTGFQRRTLEEAARSLSGVDEIADVDQMRAWLQSRNAPPLTSRSDTREFLVEIGAWSPRRAEDFTLGQKSWSIDEEAEYWRTSYGQVPPWADRDLLGSSEPGFEAIFHDQDAYFDQMREWGVFDRDAEVKLRLSGKSAAEIEEAFRKGDPILGVKGRREVELQRKYVIERYGSLVSDENGTLTAMPWLMYEDELRRYFARRGTGNLAESLIQDGDELAEVEELIDGAITEFWDKYIGPAAADGAVTYDDIFKLASEIQARLLAHPKWARRYRDLVGDALGAWASFNRALVFTQFSFAVANVVDSPIKGAWYRFTRRGLLNPGHAGVSQEILQRAAKLTPADLGLDVQASLYRFKQRAAKDYVLNPVQKGVAGALERLSGFGRAAYRAAPAVSAKAELTVKMQLARGMYPKVYAEALAKLGDADLAEAFSRKFIKDEIGRMWPTVGDGPLEKLFNEFVPFASYMVRNKVLFIGEALAHPSVLNWIEYIGRYIEDENRKRWAIEHPEEPLPDQLARRIELPWAPGYFLDLSQFADATRGLQPIFKATKPQKPVDFMAQFIRLVNPGTQAGLYMLTNALGITKRVMWEPIVDEGGFIKGYRRVVTGWTEPWSKDQPTWGSVFWVIDAMEEAQKLGAGGWTNGEISQMLGKLLAFGAIATPDRGAALYEYYKSLREKDKEFAKRWLAETENGQFLQEWLLAKSTSLRDVADRFSLMARWDADPKRWFHTQSAAFQKTVGEAYGRIDQIRTSYEDRLLDMTPGTAEYKALKAEMLLAISQVYRVTPELLVYEAYSKSASEWSQQLQRWQVDKLTDEFFALDAQRPKPEQFKDRAEFRAARDAWEHQKEVFLATYPQVRDALGEARTEFQRVQRQVEDEWDRILDRIGRRGEAIAAAKAAGEREKADLLYLAQELDFSVLEQDRVALFHDADDFEPTDSSVRGRLRDGALKTAQLVIDFDARRLEKAKREGREEQFLNDQFYAQSMKEVILKAKGGDPFGKFDPAIFVAEMRKRTRLRGMYFAKNPGKEQAWRETEQYIDLIGRWGKAARAGDWDRAERIWADLPSWVKERYYLRHPDRRVADARFDKYVSLIKPWGQAAAANDWDRADKIWAALPEWVKDQYQKNNPRKRKSAETAAYMGWVQRWVKFFENDDSKGGMQFFHSMPEWVRERYYKAHPEKRVQFEAELKFGAQLASYFAADEGNRAAYLESHPELKRWLTKYVSAGETRRQAILAAYSSIPSGEGWLRRVFREKYPEIFSAEAKGERKLRSVYNKLAKHPVMLPAFEEWVAAIFDSYNELLKLPRGRRPALESDLSRARRGGSRSAAEASQ